jgi:RNase P subunit RPR2
MAKIKRLFFDIETSFNIIGDFACGYNKHIGYNQILEERKIICICYKWEGQSKVYSLNWDKNKCDKAMIKSFLRILKQADEIVAHNGDKFDIKWIRGRCFIHGLDMMPQYNTVDTLKEARRAFNLNSNRLDYLSKITGSTGKIKTDWDMWVKITLYNHKPSLTKMVTYCKKDVVELERVYSKMKNHIKPKTREGYGYLSDCPECGSSKTIVNRHRMTAAGSLQVQFKCKDCGKYHQMPQAKYYKEKRRQEVDNNKERLKNGLKPLRSFA